jgi:hypothetical protein
MTLLHSSIMLALLVLLGGFSAPLSAGDAKMPTMTGLIDKLDADNSRVILKTIDSNPAKVKTMVVTVDKTSMVTIDKVAGAYADLKVGDHVVVKYSQGVALTVVVSRAAPAAPGAPAASPAKP